MIKKKLQIRNMQKRISQLERKKLSIEDDALKHREEGLLLEKKKAKRIQQIAALPENYTGFQRDSLMADIERFDKDLEIISSRFKYFQNQSKMAQEGIEMAKQNIINIKSGVDQREIDAISKEVEKKVERIDDAMMATDAMMKKETELEIETTSKSLEEETTSETLEEETSSEGIAESKKTARKTAEEDKEKIERMKQEYNFLLEEEE